MKAAALAFVVAALGLASGCGQGTGGPRASEPSSAGSGGALTTGGGAAPPAGAGASNPPGTAGSSVAPPLTGGTGSGGGSSVGTPCGPAWKAGASYAEGDIVAYQGGYYIAEYENPGYDPLISTYFWEPYDCAGGGGGGGGGAPMGGSSAGGAAPVGDSAFDDLVSEAAFHDMFPDRNGFYTYQGLVEATRKYPLFAGTGTDEQRRREAAAFLANVARETGELIYIEQIEKGDYCSGSAGCPCQQGKQYFGRGPIQISWNYNYCAAGQELGYDLRAQPELVAQNATIAWATGLWFWMTQRGAGTYTPHEGIVDGHGFGETIRSINGSQECGGAWNEAVTARVTFYQKFCQLLGVTPGNNLEC